MVVSLYFFEARLTKPRMLKEAHIAPTGGNILAFFMRDVEGWREYELLKMRKRFASINENNKIENRNTIML